MALRKISHVSAADHQLVSAAVAEAEHHTSGEIVTIVTDLSDDYSDIALTWASIIAFLALSVVAIFPDFYLGLLDRVLAELEKTAGPSAEQFHLVLQDARTVARNVGWSGGADRAAADGQIRPAAAHHPGTDARAQLVLDRGRPPVIRTETRRFLFWTWQVPVSIEHPIEAVTMPPVVRREGDPQGAWDQHAYLWRPDAGRLVEMIQLEHTPMFGAEWTVGWDGGGPGIAVWDTTKAWDAAGQPRGVVAAHIPQMPHFIRFDEVAAGRVNHAAFFALPRYGPGHTGYARSSDGKDSTVPLRAGERLRLTEAALRRVIAARGESSMEATVATGLRTHGGGGNGRSGAWGRGCRGGRGGRCGHLGRLCQGTLGRGQGQAGGPRRGPCQDEIGRAHV